MTVQTSTNVAGFVGNGVTTSFPIAFKFNSSADLIVEATNTVTGVTTTLSLNSDYTVDGAGDENGGTIAFTAAPLSTETVKVTRHVDLLQLTDLRNQGKFYAEVHEDVFDKLVMIDQQQQTEINDANAKSSEAVATADLANEKSDQAVAKAGQNLVDMQAQYDAFEQGAALYVIGDYAAGLVISAYNQIFRKDGEFYRAAASLDFPYTLTGNWPTESINFVSVGDAVLRQELGATAGVELVGGALGYVGNYAALRAYSGTASRLHVTGRSDIFDGCGGFFSLVDTDALDDDGVLLVGAGGRKWRRQFVGRVRAEWFGVVGGDLTQSYAAQVQKAVTTGCTHYGGVDFPSGQIRIDATITFPNVGFDLHGASGTATEFVTDVVNLVMFDFTACNGPAKTVNRIGFSKITGGVYGGIIGIKTFNTNGLLLNSVWVRGLLTGLQYHGSFINMNQCAFEYCYKGVQCLVGCVETTWVATTYYRNEQCDVELTGDNATFASIGSNHIGTRIEGWRLNDCNNAIISQVSFKDDGTGFTPDLIHLTGVSSGNMFHQVTTQGYGKRGIFCEGADVVRNRFTGLYLRNTQAAGNKAVYCLSSVGNYFEGVVERWESGVEMVGAADEFKGKIIACGIGQVLNTADYSTWDVEHLGNTSADVQQTATTIVYLKSFTGDRSGLSSIPYLTRYNGFSSVIETTAAPAALEWVAGDRAVNRAPVVGQPKGWVCTVAGSPGTWVSEGNL